MAEQDEQHERERAASPLAIRFDLISCEYAQTMFKPDAIIPEYRFEQPCIHAKTTPDQDCRDCIHMRILAVGSNLPRHLHRYHRHGTVIPVTEAQADATIELLASHNVTPLRRPAWEAQHAQEQHKRNTDAKQREIERAQTVRGAVVPRKQES